MEDHPRLLHRRSEHGYTDRPALAMPHEPESVSRHAEAQLVENLRSRTRAEWRADKACLVAELDKIGAKPYAVMVKHELKAVRRFIEQVEAELERELRQIDSHPRRGVSSS